MKQEDIKLTYEEYMMGRDIRYPPTEKMQKDARILCERVTLLLQAFGWDRAVTSGYRPPIINRATPRAAKYSKHMYCQAVDLEDVDRQLSEFCTKNLDQLKRIGLWMEDPRFTDTWVHLQTKPPVSGRRVFIPA